MKNKILTYGFLFFLASGMSSVVWGMNLVNPFDFKLIDEKELELKKKNELVEYSKEANANILQLQRTNEELQKKQDELMNVTKMSLVLAYSENFCNEMKEAIGDSKWEISDELKQEIMELMDSAMHQTRHQGYTVKLQLSNKNGIPEWFKKCEQDFIDEKKKGEFSKVMLASFNLMHGYHQNFFRTMQSMMSDSSSGAFTELQKEIKKIIENDSIVQHKKCEKDAWQKNWKKTKTYISMYWKSYMLRGGTLVALVAVFYYLLRY